MKAADINILKLTRAEAMRLLREASKELEDAGKLPVLAADTGYADRPGTGPVGQTCKTCKHATRITYARSFYKCALMERRWTHGKNTDIKIRSPACSKWEDATANENENENE